MTKYLFPLLLAVMALGSCSKNNVKIEGEIKEGGKQKVYLEQLNVDQTLVIDSTETNRKGHFVFKTDISLPTFYNIKVGKNESVTILASPDEKIEISGSLEKLSEKYWVDGSENSLWIKLLNFQLRNTQLAMDSIQKQYKALPEGKEYDNRRQELTVAWDSVIDKQIDFSKDFILKHAISPASYYALYQKFNNEDFILSPETELHSYKIVASSLSALYPESQYTKAILAHLDQINKQLRNQKIRALIENSQTSLPEIDLPNIQGDTVSLNSLKGKYIVLDFTVLNSEGSKAYIDGLKKVYDKFHRRGVEIYQVCLDPNRLAWEHMVKQYNIPWFCVWDAEALQSRIAKQWNIQNIPANYIIDPKFEIVGKNLSDRRLEERLTDLLK